MKKSFIVVLGCLIPLVGITELSARSCFNFSLGCCAPVCCAPVVCTPVCQPVCAPVVCQPACRTVYVDSCNPCCDYVETNYCYTTYNNYWRAPQPRRYVNHVTHCTTYTPRNLSTRGCICDLFNWNCNPSNACSIYNSNSCGIVQSITLSQDNNAYRCNGERKIQLNMIFNANNNSNWQACRLQEQLTNLSCNLRDRLCCQSTVCNNCGNITFATTIDFGTLESLAQCLKSFACSANLPHEVIRFFNDLSDECRRYQNHYCYSN